MCRVEDSSLKRVRKTLPLERGITKEDTMKKGLVVLLIALSFAAGSFTAAHAEFPVKPIKLIVYTKPGGAIDVFARKFTAIAAKHTDATFVVVNKDGAGGTVAINYILAEKADGYQFAAVTRSNIGKIVSTGNKIKVEDLNWMALFVSDPEAIITSRNQEVNTWEQIVADAKEKERCSALGRPCRRGKRSYHGNENLEGGRH